MNTKGTRFLAVVAVMALAFTLFVALDPADENMAMNVYNFDDDYFDPEEVTTSTNWTEDGADAYRGYFYISQDTTVKMKAVPTATLPADGLIFLVQNGATLTLDFKKTWSATSPASLPKITIYTVTGDQQQLLSNAENTTSFTGVGKVAIKSTKVQFTSAASMSAYYEAAEMTFDAEYIRTSTGSSDFDTSIAPEVDRKAYFSADDALTDLTVGYAGPEPECDVAVAPGQTIEVVGVIDADTGLEYGVATYDSTTTTYYSVGANVGDFVLTHAEDQVWAIAGKVTAKNGDSTIKVNKWKENKDDNSTTKIGYGESHLIIGSGQSVEDSDTADDQMKDGEITINGSVLISGYYFSDGTVTISNKTIVEEGSTINAGGTLILKNDMTESELTVYGTGTLQLTNNDIWNTDPATGINVIIDDFKGLVDTTGISKVARMEKEISSSNIEINQTFELFGNTTVSKTLTVYGILIVDEGVTLTIDKGARISLEASGATGDTNYAQVINYGTIVVKAEVYGEGLSVDSGKLFNYGTINMSSKSNLYDATHTETSATLTSAGLGIKNYGTISVSKSDFVTLTEFENTATGNFSMNGKFLDASEIVNKGRIVFNGADLKTDNDASVTIYNKGLSASVYVSSIDIGANASNKVTITDTKLSYYNDESEISKGNSTIVISTVDDADWTTSTVRGLTVAVAVDDDDYPMMAVSGGITRSSTNNNAKIEIEFLSANVNPNDNNVPSGGNFLVEDSLSFAKNVIWSIGNAGANTNEVKVVVNGSITFNKDADFEIIETTGKFYAYGLITCNEEDFINEVQFVGARVVDADGDTYYMPLEDAVAFATLNDIDSVDVGYVENGDDDADYTTVLSSFVIPEGMTVQTVTQIQGSDAIPKI